MLPAWFEVYIGLEGDAESISVYEAQLVHGLLQTADYARQVIRADDPEAAETDIERKVALRLSRQGRLVADDAPKLWVILDEAVLRRPVGGTTVMCAQMEHLVKAAELPNVTVQVVPFAAGAHAGMGSTFSILGFPEPGDSDVVYLEEATGSLYLERPADVRRYRRKLDYLMAAALRPDQSVDLISHTAREMT